MQNTEHKKDMPDVKKLPKEISEALYKYTEHPLQSAPERTDSAEGKSENVASRQEKAAGGADFTTRVL